MTRTILSALAATAILAATANRPAMAVDAFPLAVFSELQGIGSSSMGPKKGLKADRQAATARERGNRGPAKGANPAWGSYRFVFPTPPSGASKFRKGRMRAR